MFDTPKLKFENTDVRLVTSEAELETCLRDQTLKDHFICYTVKNRRSLLRVSNAVGDLTVSHYDIPHGRPLAQDIQQVIHKAFAGQSVIINDVSGRERREALNNPSGFAAYQRSIEMEEGVEILSRQKVGIANHFVGSANSKFRLFKCKNDLAQDISSSVPTVIKSR